MKKFIALITIFALILSALPVMAWDDFGNEEDFVFDMSDLHAADDSMQLMEVNESVKAEFEERLLSAWENMETEVPLYPDIKIHKNDIVSLYSTIFFENPQFYYVVRSFSGTTNTDGYLGQLTKLKYTEENMDNVRATWAEIDKATEEIMLYVYPDMTDFEKVMAVHDYMVLNYVYDISDMDQTYLIMLDKVGVCAAYSEAFQHMMNILGIDSTLVSSDEMGHIWNLVKIDGRWYHIDVTWDDYVPDGFAEVNHHFALLSTNAISQVEMGHTGFDMGGYSAISTIYNNAPWRDEYGSIVTIDGIHYYSADNQIMDEEGNVIYNKLDGGDGKWHLSKTAAIENSVFTGLCEVNGILYFNTDTGIFSYNPETKSVEYILEKYGICGLFADKNVLRYNRFDQTTESQFVEDGEIKVDDVRLVEPYYKDGKVVVRIYNDYDAPLWIISKGEGYMVQKVDAKSIGKAEFENGESQTIYVWKNSLEPIVEEINIAE